MPSDRGSPGRRVRSDANKGAKGDGGPAGPNSCLPNASRRGSGPVAGGGKRAEIGDFRLSSRLWRLAISPEKVHIVEHRIRLGLLYTGPTLPVARSSKAV